MLTVSGRMKVKDRAATVEYIPSPSLTMKLTGLVTPEREHCAVTSASLMSFTRSSVGFTSSNFPVNSFTHAVHGRPPSQGPLLNHTVLCYGSLQRALKIPGD